MDSRNAGGSTLLRSGSAVETSGSVGRVVRNLYGVLGLVCLAVGATLAVLEWRKTPDQPGYMGTPVDVGRAMLKLAAPRKDEIVVDLGCGDGRLVILAVREYVERGVCVDIDPLRIAEARENAQRAGVAEKIKFVIGDAREFDLSGVDVVLLYLSRRLNDVLAPKLKQELHAGARVVSHHHPMSDWIADQVVRFPSGGRDRVLHLFVIQ